MSEISKPKFINYESWEIEHATRLLSDRAPLSTQQRVDIAKLIDRMNHEATVVTTRTKNMETMARVFQKANTNFVRAARNMIRAATERAEKAKAERDLETKRADYFRAHAASVEKQALRFAEYGEAMRTRVEALEGAAREYRHAMEGFAEAVRYETGKAYPWPAQDTARAKLDSALSAPPTPAVVHASDCAVHNAPALPPGPCDCGADPAVSQKVAAALKWSAENKPGHGIHDVPGVGMVHFNDGSDPTPETLARWERDEDISRAAADVLAERRRQIEAEGWTPEHDDQHANHELAIAAACYAAPGAQCGLPVGQRPRNKILPFWPWSRDWWKPTDRRRDLVKAGALILAEIERLDRAAQAQVYVPVRPGDKVRALVSSSYYEKGESFIVDRITPAGNYVVHGTRYDVRDGRAVFAGFFEREG